MTTLALVLALAAQDGAAADFAKKLSPDGPGAALAEALKTRAGLRALKEAIRDTVAWKTRSYENDPHTHFELSLFTREDDGTLRPRPERAADFDDLRAASERARVGFADFAKRAPDKDPRYLQALYADYAAEREEDDDEESDDLQARLRRGAASLPAYLAAVDRLPEADLKRALSTPFAQGFMRAKMGRVEEDAGDPLNDVLLLYGSVEGEAVALGRLRKDVEAAEKRLVEMKDLLDAKGVPADEATRAAWVERGGADPIERFLAERAMPDDEGEVESPEEVVNAFAERRAAFLDMAERCADAEWAGLLADPRSVAALEAKRDKVVEELRRGAMKGAVAIFARRYCEGTGERYQWRADRAEKAAAIAARAKEIEKEEADEAEDAVEDN